MNNASPSPLSNRPLVAPRSPRAHTRLQLILLLIASAATCVSCTGITGTHPVSAMVFVASDRQKLALNQPLALLFGVERGVDLTFKACQLTLPQVERPDGTAPGLLLSAGRAGIKLESGTDVSAAAFEAQLANRAPPAQPGPPVAQPELLIFVHGFATEPRDAVIQAGQFAHDLDFAAPVVVFNWPTRGLYLSYFVDGLNAEWCVPDFVRLLELVRGAHAARRIHIVGHSAGARIVLRGVREFLARRCVPFDESAGIPAISPPPAGERWFGQIVLVAPDEDTEVFERSFASILAQAAARTTIYYSSRDRALDLSGWLFGYRRLGAADGPHLRPELFEQIQSIDATRVDRDFLGHCYYTDSPEVLQDIQQVLAGRSATDPQRRLDRSNGFQLVPQTRGHRP